MNDVKKYVASFILDMRGRTNSIESITDKLSKLVVELGGQVSEVKNLGQKNFERVTDKKFSNGIYIQILFQGPSNVPSGIKSKLSLDKTINRILIESVK